MRTGMELEHEHWLGNGNKVLINAKLEKKTKFS